jgi:hypothetical protein
LTRRSAVQSLLCTAVGPNQTRVTRAVEGRAMTVAPNELCRVNKLPEGPSFLAGLLPPTSGSRSTNPRDASFLLHEGTEESTCQRRQCAPVRYSDRCQSPGGTGRIRLPTSHPGEVHLPLVVIHRGRRGATNSIHSYRDIL